MFQLHPQPSLGQPGDPCQFAASQRDETFLHLLLGAHQLGQALRRGCVGGLSKELRASRKVDGHHHRRVGPVGLASLAELHAALDYVLRVGKQELHSRGGKELPDLAPNQLNLRYTGPLSPFKPILRVWRPTLWVVG